MRLGLLSLVLLALASAALGDAEAACVGACATAASLPAPLNGSLVSPKYDTPVTISEDVSEGINVFPVIERHRDVTVEMPATAPSCACRGTEACPCKNGSANGTSSSSEDSSAAAAAAELERVKAEIERIKDVAARCLGCRRNATTAAESDEDARSECQSECGMSAREVEERLQALRGQLGELDARTQALEKQEEAAQQQQEQQEQQEEAHESEEQAKQKQEEVEEHENEQESAEAREAGDETDEERGAHDLLRELNDEQRELQAEDQKKRRDDEQHAENSAEQSEESAEEEAAATNAPGDIVKEGLRAMREGQALADDAEADADEARAEQQQATEEAEQKAIDAMKDFQDDETEDAQVEEQESAVASARVLAKRAKALVADAQEAAGRAEQEVGRVERELGMALGATFEVAPPQQTLFNNTDSRQALQSSLLTARAQLEVRRAQLSQAAALHEQLMAQADDVRINGVDRALKSASKEQADKKSRAEHMLAADAARSAAARHKQRAVDLLVEAGQNAEEVEAQVAKTLDDAQRSAVAAVSQAHADQEKVDNEWKAKIVEARRDGEARRREGVKGTAVERKARRVADKTLVDVLSERARQAAKKRQYAEEDANTHERQAREDEQAGDAGHAKIERALQEVEDARANEKEAEEDELEAEIEEEEARQTGTRKDEKLAEAEKDLAKANVREKEAVVNEKIKLADIVKDKLTGADEQELVDEAERRAFVAERKLRGAEKQLEEVKLELTGAEEDGDIHKERQVEPLLRSASQDAQRLRKELDDAQEKVADMKEAILEHEQDKEEDRQVKSNTTHAAPANSNRRAANATRAQNERQKLQVLSGAAALEEQDVRLLKQKLDEARKKNDAVWVNVYEVELKNAEKDAAVKKQKLAQQLGVVQDDAQRSNTTLPGASKKQKKNDDDDEEEDGEEDEEEDEKSKRDAQPGAAAKKESLRDKLFGILNGSSRSQFF